MCSTTRVDREDVNRSQLRTAARQYQTGTYAAIGAERSKEIGGAGGRGDDGGNGGPKTAAVLLLKQRGSRGWRMQTASTSARLEPIALSACFERMLVLASLRMGGPSITHSQQEDILNFVTSV